MSGRLRRFWQWLTEPRAGGGGPTHAVGGPVAVPGATAAAWQRGRLHALLCELDSARADASDPYLRAELDRLHGELCELYGFDPDETRTR